MKRQSVSLRTNASAKRSVLMNDWNVNSGSNKPREFHHLTGFCIILFVCWKLKCNCWFYIKNLVDCLRWVGLIEHFSYLSKLGHLCVTKKMCVWEYAHVSMFMFVYDQVCVLFSYQKERESHSRPISQATFPRCQSFSEFPSERWIFPHQWLSQWLWRFPGAGSPFSAVPPSPQGLQRGGLHLFGAVLSLRNCFEVKPPWAQSF